MPSLPGLQAASPACPSASGVSWGGPAAGPLAAWPASAGWCEGATIAAGCTRCAGFVHPDGRQGALPVQWYAGGGQIGIGPGGRVGEHRPQRVARVQRRSGWVVGRCQLGQGSAQCPGFGPGVSRPAFDGPYTPGGSSATTSPACGQWAKARMWGGRSAMTSSGRLLIHSQWFCAMSPSTRLKPPQTGGLAGASSATNRAAARRASGWLACVSSQRVDSSPRLRKPGGVDAARALDAGSRTLVSSATRPPGVLPIRFHRRASRALPNTGCPAG